MEFLLHVHMHRLYMRIFLFAHIYTFKVFLLLLFIKNIVIYLVHDECRATL